LMDTHKGGIGGHRIEHFRSDHGMCVCIGSIDVDEY